ncbi:hypothetical protein ACQR1W_16160 [Bradyrhizobium sp. HKCCYLS1011]|uniref:hypothetical protein n=1 Tax=Bradyrhizobium sp. HKCCYLS1011 TaxID=3420733 RepID=UPI003EB809A0
MMMKKCDEDNLQELTRLRAYAAREAGGLARRSGIDAGERFTSLRQCEQVRRESIVADFVGRHPT